MVIISLLLSLGMVFAEGVSPLAEMKFAIELFRSQKWEESKEKFSDLVSKPNLYSEYQHFYLAQIYQKLGKKDQEEYHLNQILQSSPSILLNRLSQLRQAELLFEAGQLAKAKKKIVKVEKSLRRSGEYERAVQLLAQVEKALGNHNRYCRWIKKYSSDPTCSYRTVANIENYQLENQTANSLIQLASQLGKQQNFSASSWLYDYIAQRFPRSRWEKKSLFQAAFSCYQNGDYDGASRRFQELLSHPIAVNLKQDAQWYLAWMQYLKGNYEQSVQMFSRLLLEKRNPYRERIRYWMGMSEYRLGKYSEARSTFYQITEDFHLSYYGILSRYRLGQLKELGYGLSLSSHLLQPGDISTEALNDTSESEGVESLANEAESEAEANGELSEESDEEDALDIFKSPFYINRFERARGLAEMGLVEWAKWDLYDIERKTSNSDYLKHLMREYSSIGKYDRAAFISQTRFAKEKQKVSSNESRQLWLYAFPRAYEAEVTKYSKDFGVPENLIWSIMRAESQYYENAVSPVGARGLMQIMPFTGQKVASLMGDEQFNVDQLMQPLMAIKIGSRYLKNLLQQFDKNIVLAAASYNAGPHRVKSWIYHFGNVELDEFVDHIPFVETRNYAKKVVLNFQIYSLLYSGQDKEELNFLVRPITQKFINPEVVESWESF